jgi:hypothetical protein
LKTLNPANSQITLALVDLGFHEQCIMQLDSKSPSAPTNHMRSPTPNQPAPQLEGQAGGVAVCSPQLTAGKNIFSVVSKTKTQTQTVRLINQPAPTGIRSTGAAKKGRRPPRITTKLIPYCVYCRRLGIVRTVDKCKVNAHKITQGVSRHRPKSAANGIRFGEATNPGPTSGTEKRKQPKKREPPAHHYYECTLHYCTLRHFHEKQRAPLEGAKKRLKERERAAAKARGEESPTPRPPDYVECKAHNCEEDHHHCDTQFQEYSAELKALRETSLVFKALPTAAATPIPVTTTSKSGPSREAREQKSSHQDKNVAAIPVQNGMPDAKSLRDYRAECREERRKNSSYTTKNITPTPPHEEGLSSSEMSSGEEDDDSDTLSEDYSPPNAKSRKHSRFTWPEPTCPLLASPPPPTNPDSDPKILITRPPRRTFEGEPTHSVADTQPSDPKLILEEATIYLLRTSGQTTLGGQFKDMIIRPVTHAEDTKTNPFGEVRMTNARSDRLLGRTGIKFKAGQTSEFHVMEQLYDGTRTCYIYPSLLVHLNTCLKKRGSLAGKVNINTRDFVRNYMASLPDNADYVNARFLVGGKRVWGSDCHEDTMQVWLQAHLARHTKSDMSTTGSGVAKNYHMGELPGALTT